MFIWVFVFGIASAADWRTLAKQSTHRPICRSATIQTNGNTYVVATLDECKVLCEQEHTGTCNVLAHDDHMCHAYACPDPEQIFWSKDSKFSDAMSWYILPVRHFDVRPVIHYINKTRYVDTPFYHRHSPTGTGNHNHSADPLQRSTPYHPPAICDNGLHLREGLLIAVMILTWIYLAWRERNRCSKKTPLYEPRRVTIHRPAFERTSIQMTHIK